LGRAQREVSRMADSEAGKVLAGKEYMECWDEDGLDNNEAAEVARENVELTKETLSYFEELAKQQLESVREDIEDFQDKIKALKGTEGKRDDPSFRGILRSYIIKEKKAREYLGIAKRYAQNIRRILKQRIREHEGVIKSVRKLPEALNNKPKEAATRCPETCYIG
jgi:hypothetical protein